MGFSLREGVSFCETSGRLLFLDRYRDRYFCLAIPTEEALRRLAARDETAADRPFLDRLAADGLLVPQPSDVVPQASKVTPPSSSALAEIPAQGAPSAAIVGRLIEASIGLKLLGLRRSLTAVARRKTQASPAEACNAAELRSVALAFERASMLASPLDRCLPRSLALARHCLKRHFAVELVIGVKLQPFAAHCWVQHGEVVLNDRVEIVRNFDPIFVL